MYIITWKYVTNHRNAQQFEFAYGSSGDWCALFKQSGHHRGSYLYKSDTTAYTYFLIDMWDTAEHYEKFKKQHKTKWEELDTHFRDLYDQEEKIGTFLSLD
ncbi:hypothetical protein QQ020_01060 [Fulvivirgaceae bacterium BMA12]|uniref:ABM domain-containing protein n=1 Tax=Agaribacillus aureus TaxID=3051825 RepID=A0ABT8L1A0_9BACT|nr:hypothetical protein [Fulvivirgaceae bacterium BMA12]